MKKILLLNLLMACLFTLACSKTPGKSTAQLKLRLGNTIDASSGIGTGGAVLFGRNNLGHIFGKTISGADETLDLPNGNWVFYAFMWNGSDGTSMTGKIHCAKSAQALNGSEVTINLNLSNANCSDPEFSEGRYYVDGSNFNHFADLFIEECDQVGPLVNFKCGLDNQGSGVSYRLKMQSFKKAPNTPFIFESGALTSACVSAANLHNNPFPVNFPSGALNTPFVVSMEVFLGSSTCDTTDSKGVFQFTMNQGLRSQNPVDHKVVFSTSNASPTTPDFSATAELNQAKCEDLLGAWSSGTCNSIPPVITRFAPSSVLSNQSVATSAIKHLFAIPQSFVCNRYLNSSTTIGSHPWAGGNGSVTRPYKICTEWQLNQIGEYTAPTSYRTYAYKLMNDLDMNKADFGPYNRPHCVGVTNTVLKAHHNLNPLDILATGDCTTIASNTGFSGTFFGNKKTIKNARILTESIDDLGFTRKLHGGKIKDLNFKNLEVRGRDYIGGIVGNSDGSVSALNFISGVNLESVDIEGRTSSNQAYGNNVGGIAGRSSGFTDINDVHINQGRIRGRDSVGGLIGYNEGKISRCHFRGNIKNNIDGPQYTGGLVGFNVTASSSINRCFSEGVIEASVSEVGGIAAKSFGYITNSYSTMTILSRFNGGVKIAGILATLAGGSVSNVYFNGVLKYLGGGGTSTIAGGIVSYSSGSVANSYTTYGTPGYNTNSLTDAQLRSGSVTFSIPAEWTQNNSNFPRLYWENRICNEANNNLSVSNQISNLSRGSETNPVIVCNLGQWLGLNGRSEYFRLGDDIDLKELSASGLLATFNGVLNGAGRSLYGASINLSDDAETNTGLIKILGTTGKIKNINLWGNKLFNSLDAGDTSTALLVGENNGEITNLQFAGNEVAGYMNTGLISGKNNGVISLIKTSENSLSGYSAVGAVAGITTTNSVISKIDIKAELTNIGSPTAYGRFGGIVGDNSGSIDQAHFNGKIKFNSVSTAELQTGGISGVNAGLITNSYTDNASEIWVKNNSKVGGLIGENLAGATLNRSFSLGKIIFDNNDYAADGDFHALIGLNSGSANTSFFLENNIGSFLQQVQTSSACSTGASCPITPSLTIISVNGADRFSLTNGDGSLVNMTPITAKGSSSITWSQGSNLNAGVNLYLFHNFTMNDISASRTKVQFATLGSYCSSWSGITGSEVCSGGYDIVQENVKGHNRLMNYYAALLNDAPIPSNSPVWTLENSEGHPKLLQVEQH